MTPKKFLIWLLIATFLTSFFLLSIMGSRLSPILYRYVNVEAKRFASNIVNSAVNDTISENITEDLFEINKNAKEEVEILTYNTKKVNELLSKITQKIQTRLLHLEEGDLEKLSISDNFKTGKFTKIKGGVLCEIPMGAIRGNSMFVNLGPIIPIRMSFLGQVQSNLKTKVTNYGINNLVIEITVHVEVEEQITMPTMSKSSTIKIDAPLTIKIIQGVVPNYYVSGFERNSNTFSLPVEE